MHSSVFKEETSRLRVRSLSDADVLSIAGEAFQDPNIQALDSGSKFSFDDFIKVLAESIPSGELTNEQIRDFLKAKRLLSDAIEKDKDLIDWYCDRPKVQRALPILGSEEIALIIITAFLTGTISTIAKELVERAFSVFSRRKNKEELRKALDLIFSNSILAVLEAHGDGLTASEIAEMTDMQEEGEVNKFLAKYKSQGWIHKKSHQDREEWKIKEGRAKIIEGYLKLSGD